MIAGVRQSAEVSNQLTSVERVLEYRDLEPEIEPNQPHEVSAEWPQNGTIEFRKIVYRYFADAEPVLRDLSFTIKSREKIGKLFCVKKSLKFPFKYRYRFDAFVTGIVGRTGAGKSSLIGVIFRMACIEGQILIDGVDTSLIRLKDLRKRVAIIPQDPVLFSGTLRR